MARYSLFMLKVPLNPKQTNMGSVVPAVIDRTFTGLHGSNFVRMLERVMIAWWPGAVMQFTPTHTLSVPHRCQQWRRHE